MDEAALQDPCLWPRAGRHVSGDPHCPGDLFLCRRTVCGDAMQAGGRHYDLHNLYGWSQTAATLEGVREATGTRGLVLSRYSRAHDKGQS